MKDCRVSTALWEISMNKGYNFNNNRIATRNLSFADAQKIQNQRDLETTLPQGHPRSLTQKCGNRQEMRH